MELPTGQKFQWRALSFVWEVVLSIVIPTTLLALLGRWLDQRWHTSPWMTLLGLVLALGSAYLIAGRKATEYQEMMREETNHKPPT